MSAIHAAVDLDAKSGRVVPGSLGDGRRVVAVVHRISIARVWIGDGPCRDTPRPYADVLPVPPGVFAAARESGQDRVTWQPEAGARGAIVVVASDAGERTGWDEDCGRHLSFVPIVE